MRKEDVLMAVIAAAVVVGAAWAYRRGLWGAAAKTADVGSMMKVPYMMGRSPDRIATGQPDGGVVWL